MDYPPDNEFDFSAAIYGVPHDQRWAILKPELEVLFHSDKDYTAIAQHMKTKYAFDAQVSAYKYRFKKWKWKRSIPNHKKEIILTHTQTRTLQGKRTASASFGTTVVNPKKLKRYVASMQHPELDLSSFVHETELQLDSLGVYLPSGVRPFTMWSASFGGASRSIRLSASSPSSSNKQTKTPNDIDFRTPSHSYTPGITSPTNQPSPLSAAVITHASSSRAQLFSKGKLIELVQTMDHSQQRTMSNWLYQFWFFAFKSAKDWGHNFQQWNVESLDFAKYRTMQLSDAAITPGGTSLSSPTNQMIDITKDVDSSPSDLCRWSIHVDEDTFYGKVENLSTEDDEDGLDEWPQESFHQCLLNGLRDNQFATISTEQAPVNLELVAKAAESSPQVLFGEAVSFAIMAQNYEALKHMLKERPYEEVSRTLEEICAMHIATSYLNGSKQCCNIFALICSRLRMRIKDAYSNDYGHTVLDNLMLTILKCHSTAPMESVDDSLKKGTRYAGIEVDICGRWDADSPCFRSLVARGEKSLPHHWKHKFCNTSVQAICHCIGVLAYFYNLTWQDKSGLFQKLCTHCGMKLQLSSLHTLIMVGFLLANNACTGEDLFGIIACYLCLVYKEFDPLHATHISIPALIGTDGESNNCNHQLMTPYALMIGLSDFIHDSWSKELMIGWRLLSEVCRRVESGYAELKLRLSSSTIKGDGKLKQKVEDEIYNEMNEYFEKHCDYHIKRWSGNPFPFGTDPALCHLWMSIQAEFLNYRRINEGDAWLSANFIMANLADRFESDEVPLTGYSRNGLLLAFCQCASFIAFRLPLREDLSREGLYFANMDCWERSSFIEALTLDEIG